MQPASYHSSSSSQSNRAHDLYQVKMAIQAHTKRTQEEYTTQRTVHVQPQAKKRELKSTSATGTFNSNKNFNSIENIQFFGIFSSQSNKIIDTYPNS